MVVLNLKRMKVLSVVFSVLAFVGSVFSQDSIVIRGEVIEKLTKSIIPNASITVKIDSVLHETISNQRGGFFLRLPKAISYSLSIQHELYLDTEKEVFYRAKNDTIEVVVPMFVSAVKNLDEAHIYAPGIPVKVFGDSILSVDDFEILKDGKLILLTYSKRLEKGSELLLWENSKVISRSIVNGVSEELLRDYRGNAHLICKDKVYGIYNLNEEIVMSAMDKEYFTKYLGPILDTNKSKLFFSNFNKDYPSFGYYTYDQIDSTYKKIVEITDDLMMELYRSEYKWVDVRTKLWAKNKELKTGIDAEIWVGANYFTQSVYYKQLYAPMFHRNDTLFVFDYYKDLLRRYDGVGEAIDSIPIFHHYFPKETGWKKKLIQDQVTGQLFAVMNLAGYSYLRHLDTETGKLGPSVKLEFRYVEKIEIYNNAVYYIYRPYESKQKKFLYKESLPFEFEKGRVPNGDRIK